MSAPGGWWGTRSTGCASKPRRPRCSRSRLSRECLGGLLPLLGEGTRLSPAEAANALYGMRYLHTPSKLVYNFHTRLSEAVAEAAQGDKAKGWGSQELGSALYGLRTHVGSSARRVLAALAPLLRALPAPLEQQAVGAALHGLVNQGDTPELCAALGALADHAARCTEMNNQSLAMAMHGLQGMPACAEADAMLSALRRHLSRLCRGGGISVFTAANALFGLRGRGSSPEAAECLALLAPRVLGFPPEVEAPVFSQSLTGLAALADAGHDTGRLIRSVLDRVPTGPVPDGASAAALRQSLSLVGGTLPPSSPGTCTAEGATDSLSEATVVGLLKHARVSGLRFHVQHESGFEMDILTGRVNVELDSDGHWYASPARRNHFELRRKVLLERHGIEVHRITTTGRSLREVIDLVAEYCGAGLAWGPCRRAWDRARTIADAGWDWARFGEPACPQMSVWDQRKEDLVWMTHL
eukprot:TRINITY_DN19092_c0_g1_i2.p1 TRINITY_DN19092_c0_g1~~TRINITY_DN19092_c0_g1_i2.p1  ORF type:complete len:469 (+),score=101.98 TRINITY_DN19092_c0_g1_i2:942-2348(+)